MILRKDFQLIQLLQIPLSVLFAWFTDIGLMMVAGIPVELYPVRILCVLLGTGVLGFGISLAVTIIMSLFMFDFKLVGTREGTVIAAFCTGLTVKFFLKHIKDKVEKLFALEK